MSTTNLVLGLDTLSAREQLQAFKVTALQALRGIGVEIDDAPIAKIKADLEGLKKHEVKIKVSDGGAVAKLAQGISEIFANDYNVKLNYQEAARALNATLDGVVSRTRVVQLATSFGLDDSVLNSLPAVEKLAAAIQGAINGALGANYKLASTQELETQIFQAAKRALDLALLANHDLGIDEEKLKARIANAANTAPIKLDQTIAKALREGIKSPIPIEIDTDHVLNQLRTALAKANLKVDVNAASPKGAAGTGINYGELKNILQGILVPVADEMVKVSDSIVTAAKKVSSQRVSLPEGIEEPNPVRATRSRSAKLGDTRIGVSQRLDDPEAIEAAIAAQSMLPSRKTLEEAQARLAKEAEKEANRLAKLAADSMLPSRKTLEEAQARLGREMQKEADQRAKESAEQTLPNRKLFEDAQKEQIRVKQQINAIELKEAQRQQAEAERNYRKQVEDTQPSRELFEKAQDKLARQMEAEAAKRAKAYADRMLPNRGMYEANEERLAKEAAAFLPNRKVMEDGLERAYREQVRVKQQINALEVKEAQRLEQAVQDAIKRDAEKMLPNRAVLEQGLAKRRAEAEEEVIRKLKEDAAQMRPNRSTLDAQIAAQERARLSALKHDAEQMLPNRRMLDEELERVSRETLQAKIRQNNLEVTAAQAAQRRAEAEKESARITELNNFLKQKELEGRQKYSGAGPSIYAAQALAGRLGSTDAARAFLNRDGQSRGYLLDNTATLKDLVKGPTSVTGALEELNRAVGDAKSGVRGLAGALNMLWTTWGSTVPIVAMAALGAAVRSTITIGKDLEYQLQFVASLSEQAAVSTAQFRQTIRGFSVGATEAAEALRGLAQNGLGVQESLYALPTILRLATVGEMQLSDAALGATGVMEAFNLTVGDLPRIADVFAKAAAISNTSVSGMVESMRQASTVSDQYSISLEEVGAALATMAKRNITGSAAGTAYRNMWVELATPTKKASEAMKSIGLEVFDANKKLLDADVIMRRVRDSVAGLNEQSKLGALNAIFGERGSKAVNAILADFDAYEARRDELLNNSKDFTRKVSEDLNQTLNGKYKALIAEYQGMTLEVFEQTSSSLKGIVDEVRLLIADPALTGGLKSLVTGFVDLTRYVMENGKTILWTIGAWQGGRFLLGAAGFISAVLPQLVQLRLALMASGAAAAATGATTAAGMGAAAAGAAGAATATTGLRVSMLAAIPVARTLLGALTGGIGLVLGLATQYFLLRDSTDEATRAQRDYLNTLDLGKRAQEDEIERLSRRNRMLDRAQELLRNQPGMTYSKAMEQAERETDPKGTKNARDDFSAKTAEYTAMRNRYLELVGKMERVEKVSPNPGMMPSYRADAQEASELRAKLQVVWRERETLWSALSTAQRAESARAANSAKESLASQTQQVEDLNRMYREMGRANKKLLDEVKPLELPTAALPADEFKEKADAFKDLVNSYGRNVALPDGDAARAAREARAEQARIDAARRALEQALSQWLKAEAARRVQAARDSAADELQVLQAKYETDEITYSRYLKRKEELTRQIEDSKVQEAGGLVLQLQARRDSAEDRVLGLISKGTRGEELDKARAEYIQALTDVTNAEAAADRADADRTTARVKRQQEVVQGIRDRVKAVRDEQLSSVMGSNSKLFSMNTEQGRMRDQINMLPRGTDDEIKRFKELSAAVDQYVEITEQKVMNDSMKQFFDSLGDSMKSFGDGVLGVVESFQALTMIRQRAAEEDKRYGKLINESEEEGKTDDVRRLTKERQRSAELFRDAETASYAKVAASSKKFFDQKTGAYKALDAIEKAYHAQRLMESSTELGKKLSDAGAWIATKLGMIWTETTAQLTSDTTKTASAATYTATDTAMSATRTGQKAIEAQTAALTLPPPFSFAALAATVAILASLGVAGRKSGGGAAPSNMGTGTVFGDSEKPSESLSKSIEHLSDIDLMTARYSGQMAQSLRNIEGNIGGVANLLIRGGTMDASAAGVRTGFKQTTLDQLLGGNGNALLGGVMGASGAAGFMSMMGMGLGPFGIAAGALLGGVLAKPMAKLFGTSTKITGQGVEAGPQSIESVLADGLQSRYFTDVRKKKKFAGVTTSDKRKSLYSDASTEYEDQTTKIIRNYVDLMNAAAGPLGVSLETIRSRLSGFVVSVGRIDLKGLSGEEAQKRLESVFSAVGDNIAAAALSGLMPFQAIGEGYLETVVRVASGVEVGTLALRRLRIAAVDYTAIANKQGDVAAELIRQSLLAKEGVSGVADVLAAMEGGAEDLVSAFLTLTNVRTTLRSMGMDAAAVGIDLINGAGGLTELADAVSAFEDSFFFTSEKVSFSTDRLSAEFSKLGLAMPSSSAGFVSLVRGIDTSTQAGRELLGTVLGLSSQFGDLVSAMDELKDARIDLQAQLLEAQGKKTEALALQRERELEQMDPTLRALQQQVWAAQDLAEKMENLTSAGQNLAQFIESLTQQANETRGLEATRAAYQQNLALAGTDDANALDKMVDLAQAYLDAAKNTATTQAEYLAVMARVRADIAGLNATQVYYRSIDGSHAGGLEYVPFDGYVAELHRGERVQTASEAKSSDETAGQIEGLRAELKAQNAAIATYSQQVAKILTRWENDGMPEQRTTA